MPDEGRVVKRVNGMRGNGTLSIIGALIFAIFASLLFLLAGLWIIFNGQSLVPGNANAYWTWIKLTNVVPLLWWTFIILLIGLILAIVFGSLSELSSSK